MSENSIKSVGGVEVQYTEVPEEIKAIQEELAEENSKQLNFTKFPLRPSGASKDDLELYMELENWHEATNGREIKYKPAKLDGRVCSLLKLGHTIEPQVIDHVSKLHKILFTNKTVKYGEIKTRDGGVIELRGELDMALEDTRTGTKMVGDSKTSGRFAFNLTPKAEHFAQINLYLHSEEMRSQGFTEGRIYYYNKDNSEMKAYSFKYSPELAQAVLDKFQRIYSLWEAETRPAQEIFWGGSDWRADYGSFREVLHERFTIELSQRPQKIDSVSFSDFEDTVKSLKQKGAVNVLAKKYDNKVLVDEKTGRQAYLQLTSKGLVAIIEKEDGFSSLPRR